MTDLRSAIKETIFEWQMYWSQQEDHYKRFTRLVDANMQHHLADMIATKIEKMCSHCGKTGCDHS